MALTIRLRRTGKTKYPCYRLAVVDSRVKRDGRFIEFVGYYHPMTKPHTVKLNEERILKWLGDGASYSDTVGSLLRQSGLLKRWSEMGGGKAVPENKGSKAESRTETAQS